jgi:hypothetical protein
MDIKHQLIREIETTLASMHDSQIDLTKPGEVHTVIVDTSEANAKAITQQ